MHNYEIKMNTKRATILALTPENEVYTRLLDHLKTSDVGYNSRAKLYKLVDNDYIVINNTSFEQSTDYYISGYYYRTLDAVKQDYILIDGE